MPEPHIHVNGSRNRTAGRDYHEYRGPEPCPCCEQRYLTPGRIYCRHCEFLFEQEENQRKRAEIRSQRQKVAQKVSFFFMLVMGLGLLLNELGPKSWGGIALTISGVSALIVMIILKAFS
ncbi:TPA: hypothetical protein ACXNDR_003954 [Serratia marcescens]